MSEKFGSSAGIGKAIATLLMAATPTGRGEVRSEHRGEDRGVARGVLATLDGAEEGWPSDMTHAPCSGLKRAYEWAV